MWQIWWRKGHSAHAWLPADPAWRYLLAYLDLIMSPLHHLALFSSSPAGICRNTKLSSLGFRKHYCMGLFIADTENAKEEGSTSALFQSKPSWPFRVSNCVTWRGVSLYCVTLTTSPCPPKSLHTVTSKNRFWPFLKKTLSNNFAEKSHSTPTLDHCECYVCVDLFRVPGSIFGNYEPVTFRFLFYTKLN